MRQVSAEQTGICLSQECPSFPAIWECVSRSCRRVSGFFPFQKLIRGRKGVLSRFTLSRCMATGSTIRTRQDEPKLSWELA